VSELLTASEIRSLVVRLGIRPTKTLGQNFVNDQNTVRRIVRAAELEPGEVVLEIGPGLGSLTLGLLAADTHVTAVEIDDVLASALPDTVAAHAPEVADRLHVVHADALTLTAEALAAVAEAPPTALVANLPYNVAVPILLRMLELLPTLRTGLVMVQAEVAERLAAGPGSKAYGVPSAKLAWYASAVRAGSIPRTVFWPSPNVDSGLVRFTSRARPTAAPRAQVFTVIDQAFSQRRKMLRSALSGWAGSPAESEALLIAAGVDPSARGETLDVQAFTRIAAAKIAATGDAEQI
jgi:16S rRNA (adenine1518-N6/adenine1519-N6)-dimethyltransferase